MNSSEKY